MSLFTTKVWKGSLTVETAFVLPVFLFFILTFFVFFDLMSEQGDIQQSLISTAKQSAVLLYEVPSENDLIELKIRHWEQPKISFFSRKPIPGYVHVSARAWTGADHVEGVDASGAEVVYKTLNGIVYHTNPDCSYLNPSIEAVAKQQIEMKRNAGGELYKACELCGQRTFGTVYITDYGNRYHKDITCSGLRRTILIIPKEEAEGHAYCTKCAGRG